MEEFWATSYKSKSTPPPSPINATKPSPNTYIAHLQSKKKARTLTDEYELYLSIAPIDSDDHDPRKWWLEPMQQKLYPNLSRMALDMLSIPAMSAEPERIFSGVKMTITDRRARLGMELVEALKCLKSWMGLESWMEETIIVDRGDGLSVSE